MNLWWSHLFGCIAVVVICFLFQLLLFLFICSECKNWARAKKKLNTINLSKNNQKKLLGYWYIQHTKCNHNERNAKNKVFSCRNIDFCKTTTVMNMIQWETAKHYYLHHTHIQNACYCVVYIIFIWSIYRFYNFSDIFSAYNTLYTNCIYYYYLFAFLYFI